MTSVSEREMLAKASAEHKLLNQRVQGSSAWFNGLASIMNLSVRMVIARSHRPFEGRAKGRSLAPLLFLLAGIDQALSPRSDRATFWRFSAHASKRQFGKPGSSLPAGLSFSEFCPKHKFHT